MKTSFWSAIFLLLIITWGCGTKSNDHHNHASSDTTSGNQALYDEVMKIHDEVMPKMNDIHKLKQDLRKKIESTATMAEAQKKEIEETIVKLDSASDGMMVWMRQFNPIPDSVGEEKAREYLENEMEKVKKVKQDITEALKKAEASIK